MLVKFNRTKEHCNIGTIGHIDHGKTTLTSAITKVLSKDGLAKFFAYENIDKHKEEAARKITINTASIEYETEKRHYSHVDCPGHQQYVKNMITGASQMEGAILVVSATEGPQEQTREHIILAKEIGIKYIVVFLNKVDAVKEEELIEFAELEIRELLSLYGFDDVPVIKGSARRALDDDVEAVNSIKELLNTVDDFIKQPERALDQPFLMPIKEIFNITGRGCVVSGNVERGQLKIGNEVFLKGFQSNLKTSVIGIESFNKSLEEAFAGDNIGVSLRGLSKESAHRGQVLCMPSDIISLQKSFLANIYILTPEEGGRAKPFGESYKPHFFVRTADVSGDLVFQKNVTIISPGEKALIKIILKQPLVLEKNLSFTIREGGKTIGGGTVFSIDKNEIDNF